MAHDEQSSMDLAVAEVKRIAESGSDLILDHPTIPEIAVQFHIGVEDLLAELTNRHVAFITREGMRELVRRHAQEQ